MCRLMGLATGPELPPLDVKSVIIIYAWVCVHTLEWLCRQSHRYSAEAVLGTS